jgi:catechol 2,3-dioxygenase-like lactoylglutathione lyase family enzyme
MSVASGTHHIELAVSKLEESAEFFTVVVNKNWPA